MSPVGSTQTYKRMATKDCGSESDIKKREELEDITTCCICTEVYNDPKALPCIHTFCMKCIRETGLKANKGPGDEMPCPICRRLFKIPPEGFRGLPKHLFIEKLIQVSNLSDHSASSKFACDACEEENKVESVKEIPAATTYCVDCNQKFCEECCRQHRKFKLTRNHKLKPIIEYKSGQGPFTDLPSSVCELHEQKILDVYCADCKTVLCAICFIDGHKHHEGSHVDKFVDDFRRQIERNAEEINGCRSKSETKKLELTKVREDIDAKVDKFECDIANRKVELKQLMDKHEASLLQGLCSIRQSKLKEIQMATDDIDTYMSCLETYNSYCQKILSEGSASDICGVFSDLSLRSKELQKQLQPTVDVDIQSFNVCLVKPELEAFLEASYDNLIGEIEGVEATLLKPIQSLDNDERTAWEEERKELMKQIKELQQDASDSRGKCLDLEQKLKLERTENEYLKEQTQEYRRTIGERKDKYKADPVLVHTMRLKSRKRNLGGLLNIFRFATRSKFSDEEGICGLTILDKEMFVVSRGSSVVEVYDTVKFSFSRRWNLKELNEPLDMGSCGKNKCLYIIDLKKSYESSDILRVDPTGKLIKKWSAGEDIGVGVSVTGESNVIFTGIFQNKLSEYSPDGQLIREIDLSTDSGIRNPMHAVKLINGDFVVIHGHSDNELHRACVVDADGKLKKSFGGTPGSTIGQMNSPIYFSVDGNGFVMVTDQLNSRVLLLDSNLEFKRELLSKEKHGLREPAGIILDESNGRLFVTDNQANYDVVLIFCYKLSDEK